MKSIKIESYPQGALRLLKHCVIGAQGYGGSVSRFVIAGLPAS
jgi:hypothetical protein